MLTEQEARERAGQLAQDGRLIEAGWVSLMLRGAPGDIKDHQLELVRYAFFRGARHMMALMERVENDNVSDEVLSRLTDDLRKEFLAFTAEVNAQHRRNRAMAQH